MATLGIFGAQVLAPNPSNIWGRQEEEYCMQHLNASWENSLPEKGNLKSKNIGHGRWRRGHSAHIRVKHRPQNMQK